MIHAWQADRLGTLGLWRLPEWLREGMAYAWSQDPRPALTEPFQSYRARFEEWNQRRGDEDCATALARELGTSR
jgi:hypothetical protein